MQHQLLLIKGGEVYTPGYLGVKDVLIGAGRVLSVDENIDVKGVDLKVIDAKGKRIIPGLIDAHVHIAGAGGEGGPATRTPEMQLSQMLSGGITTVVGCLGTDGITRTPDSVLMKAKALRAEGVSAFMYTGSYQVPTPTVTGNIARDLAIIDEIIGVGEVALSDHRSSCPTTHELIRLTEEARVGGMLGGKAGVVNIHMGDAKNPFQPLHDAVNQSELTYKQFYPTHCNRNDYIFEDAKTYGKQGWIDITASSYPYFPEYEIKPSVSIKEFLNAGIPIEHITMTSDGNGSLPGFDAEGNLIKLEMGQPRSIYTELVATVVDEKIPLEIALKTITSNVANILKLKAKGKIKAGADADITIIDAEWNICDVIAMGELMVENKKALRKGTYE